MFNVLLSYQIQGGFYAYMENRKMLGDESILYLLDEISRQLNSFQITPERQVCLILNRSFADRDA